MTGTAPRSAPLPCIELVELLTAYLDGALPAEVERSFDEHLRACAGCQIALDQWRTVTHLARQLSPEDVADLDPYIRNRFLTTLRTLRRR